MPVVVGSELFCGRRGSGSGARSLGLLQEGPARSHSLGGESYWVDGIIQLQGKATIDGPYDKMYRFEMFPWSTPPIPIGRTI